MDSIDDIQIQVSGALFVSNKSGISNMRQEALGRADGSLGRISRAREFSSRNQQIEGWVFHLGEFTGAIRQKTTSLNAGRTLSNILEGSSSLILHSRQMGESNCLEISPRGVIKRY